MKVLYYLKMVNFRYCEKDTKWGDQNTKNQNTKIWDEQNIILTMLKISHIFMSLDNVLSKWEIFVAFSEYPNLTKKIALDQRG